MMTERPSAPWNYLEVGVGVGVRQPGGARVLLVLEGPAEGLRDGAQVEDAHGRSGDAVPGGPGEKDGGSEPAATAVPPHSPGHLGGLRGRAPGADAGSEQRALWPPCGGHALQPRNGGGSSHVLVPLPDGTDSLGHSPTKDRGFGRVVCSAQKGKNFLGNSRPSWAPSPAALAPLGDSGTGCCSSFAAPDTWAYLQTLKSHRLNAFCKEHLPESLHMHIHKFKNGERGNSRWRRHGNPGTVVWDPSSAGTVPSARFARAQCPLAKRGNKQTNEYI